MSAKFPAESADVMRLHPLDMLGAQDLSFQPCFRPSQLGTLHLVLAADAMSSHRLRGLAHQGHALLLGASSTRSASALAHSQTQACKKGSRSAGGFRLAAAGVTGAGFRRFRRPGRFFCKLSVHPCKQMQPAP